MDAHLDTGEQVLCKAQCVLLQLQDMSHVSPIVKARFRRHPDCRQHLRDKSYVIVTAFLRMLQFGGKEVVTEQACPHHDVPAPAMRKGSLKLCKAWLVRL